MAGYIGKSQGVTQVDGYTASEADSEFVNDPNAALNISSSASANSATIDASGNVLVGKTSSSTTTVGFEARSNGQTVATVDGGTALIVNRETSDGDVIKVMKDGTTVGSIGVDYGTEFYVGGGGGGFYINTGTIRPTTGGDAGTLSDNSHDLGSSAHRFKDLYLSGGVYLGGTGSANHLDDYEEGTWTPALVNHTLTIQKAQYTKIGRQVHLFAQFTSSSTSTIVLDNSYIFTGIPFTPDSGSPKGLGGIVQWYSSHGGSRNALGDMLWNDGTLGLDTEIIVVRGTFNWADCTSITINVTYNTTA